MIDPEMESKGTVCPLDCPDSCSMIATLEDGKVVSLVGDASMPYTRGVLCRKMKNYHERVYGHHRVLYPQKRVGRKGEGHFQRISWGEAYGILTEKINHTLRDHGGESILPFVYAGNMGLVNRFAGYPLFNKLGTSKLEETICSSAAKAGWKTGCGDIPGAPPEQAEEAEVVIIWGGNTKVTNMHFWPYVAAARKNGATLIVVDPYRNVTAASADIHLQVKPGEDTALALGLLQALMGREALDRTFLDECTLGFAKLEEYLAQQTFSSLLIRAGIGEEKVNRVIDLLAQTNKVFIRIGVGMSRNSSAAMSIRAITSLAAALGLFDGGKGKGVLLTSSAFKGDQEKLTWDSLAVRERRTFNMVQLGNALATASPPLKMLFVYNANPLSVTPDGSLVRRAMTDEGLFTIVHEQVMTPTARYADLLLPATTFLENRDLYTGYGHHFMRLADRVIQPVGEAKSNFDFFQDLARELDLTDEPFGQSLDVRLTDYLESMTFIPDDISITDILGGKLVCSDRWQQDRPLFSKSGRKYLFVQKTDVGQPPHPCCLDTGEFHDPDHAARFPFKLITPPHADLLNSTFGERYTGLSGTVLIHPEDSAAYGVMSGDEVTLYNNRGWNRRIARVTEDTQRGLLVAEGIFWQHEENLSGINDLTSQKLTDMGGGGTFHEARVALMPGKKAMEPSRGR